jgi:hypothetical protein
MKKSPAQKFGFAVILYRSDYLVVISGYIPIYDKVFCRRAMNFMVDCFDSDAEMIIMFFVNSAVLNAGFVRCRQRRCST